MAEEGDGAVEAFTDGDGGATEAVAAALALDLVLAAAVTAGEIAAKLSGGMEGEDEVEGGRVMEQVAVGVLGGFWGHREALVVVGDELGQEGVGALDVVDAA